MSLGRLASMLLRRMRERVHRMSNSVPFGFIPCVTGRTAEKPRACGLTMMIDQGLPVGFQRDLMETASDYVDLAKFKTGTSRLYSLSNLERKLRAYIEHGVKPFIGGQFHEYVFATHGTSGLPMFYAEARRVGFAALEVSDNVVPLTSVQRRDQIRAAIDAGFEVFGEVGAKDRRSTAAELVAQAGECFKAGASLVLVEAAELVTAGKPNRPMIDEIARGVDMARVMIELPGPWIPEVRACDIEALKKFLVNEFGPDVNVANVQPDTVIDFEATRRGLGVAGPHGFVAS
jgi:phosphosulfolactate synthase